MDEVQLTAEEVFDSLTGFDEMAITQHFGRSISDLGADATMFGRALAFVLKRREGVSDDDARNAALNLALKDVASFFAEESEESGKDVPSPAQSPATSPVSVS